MNEAKVRAVIDHIYDLVHNVIKCGDAEYWDLDEALLEIRDKIEELDDDDLGRQ
jgi:hypothetical protein